MNELLKKNNPELDFDSIVKEIREKVNRKIELGLYDHKEIKHIADLKLEIPNPLLGEIKRTEKKEKIEETFHFLDTNWDIMDRMTFTSPRKTIGPIVARIKKIGFTLFRWVLGPALHHQTSYNVQNFLFLAELKAFVERMETDHFNYLKEQREELIDLRNRYHQTSQRQLFLEKNYIQLNKLEEKIIPKLQEQTEKFSEHLINQDQAISFQKRKLDAIFTKFQEAVDGKPGSAEAVLAERNKIDEFDYYLFENLHRGSNEVIRERQKVYLPFYQGQNNVLDIGCGRGEMLELFKENKISARGIDMNDEMVRVCTEKGLDVTSAEALSYLENLPEQSLGGLISAQVIEHIPSDHLVRLVRLALEKLEPGAPIALETVNPQCLTTFSGAFYLDMSHIKPVHPEAVRFLLERAGFHDVQVIYLTPYPEELKLKKIDFEKSDVSVNPDTNSENGSSSDKGSSSANSNGQISDSAKWEAAVAVYNENVEKLNQILFSHQDYAVVAKR